MNIVCVICADCLTPTNDVFYTPCGHLFHFVCITQWLERSKTCPQCRVKVTENKIHRIFFNFANNDSCVEDSTTLQAQVDSLKFEVMMKDRAIQEAEKRVEKNKKESAGLRKEVRKLEDEISQKDTAIIAFKGQIKYFKEQSSDAEIAKKEVLRLKKKLEEIKSVQLLIQAPSDIVDEMITNTRDPSRLVTYITVLKKELTSSVARRKQLKAMISKTEQELTKVSMERNFLIGEHEKRKELEELVATLESKNFELEKRIREFEEGSTGGQTEKLAESSKASSSKTSSNGPRERETVLNSKSAKNVPGTSSHNSSIIDLTTDVSVRQKNRTSTKRNNYNIPTCDSESENEENALSFGTKYNIVSETTLKKKTKSVSENSAYWMLAKKPRLVGTGHSSSEMTFDGFGGHSKNEKFPDPKPKCSKGPFIRKAKLDDGSNRKIGDYVLSDP